MKQNIYSIYDKVACVFNKPFIDLNDASAMRAFRDASEEQKHFTDYELYRLASYTDNDGLVVAESSPVRLLTGLQVESEKV